MTARPNYFPIVPTLVKKYTDFSLAVKQTAVAKELGELVVIRASQLNGCAFCLDMHVKEAKIRGERELRLHHIAIWRESPLFNERERAALAWTELLTRLPEHGVADADYEAARSQFSEQELADLSFLVVSINGWNRMGVAYRRAPGSADEAFGLGKAGLN